MMDITFHYPPELFNMMVDTIPLLCRSKQDVLLFFRGAGVSKENISDLQKRVDNDKENITKYEIARTVLTRINEEGESTLRERREVLKRVVEFEEFSSCWSNDQLKAKGLVSGIQKLVNVKDSFTRMKQEKERETIKRKQIYEEKVKTEKFKKDKIENIKKDFYALFSESNPQKRGLLLEPVLNDLFSAFDISIRDSFRVSGDSGEGTIEQIDGVVELDGEVYLVEMKWKSDHVSKRDMSNHLVSVYHRRYARGIMISYSDYTKAALAIAKESLQKTVFVLCKLDEIVMLLEENGDLKEMLKKKVHHALIDKEPFANVQ